MTDGSPLSRDPGAYAPAILCFQQHVQAVTSSCHPRLHWAGPKGKSMENGRAYVPGLEVARIPFNHSPLSRTQLFHQYFQGGYKMEFSSVLKNKRK